MTAISDSTPVKTCTKCGECKPFAMFSKRSKSRDGLDQYCKSCKSAARKLLWKSDEGYRLRSLEASRARREGEGRAEHLKALRDYYAENRDVLLAKARERYAQKKEEILAQNKRYYESNKGKILEWHSLHRKANRDVCNARSTAWIKRTANIDPLFRLKLNVRALIGVKIRQMGYTKRSSTTQILGCDWEFFKSHIERQFLRGMTWDNRSDWHLDHIRPMSEASSEEEVLALNHFTNLRPIWAKDNLRKGSQITHLI